MTTLNPGRSRTLTASFFAADGKPARVDGDPVWGVSDPAVAELVDTSSAFSKKVRAIGPGTCEVYLHGRCGSRRRRPGTRDPATPSLSFRSLKRPAAR
jgi:hypothetical protein